MLVSTRHWPEAWAAICCLAHSGPLLLGQLLHSGWQAAAQGCWLALLEVLCGVGLRACDGRQYRSQWIGDNCGMPELAANDGLQLAVAGLQGYHVFDDLLQEARSVSSLSVWHHRPKLVQPAYAGGS